MTLLLTLLFSTLGGDQGVLGTQWNAAVERAFGTGKVLVPVALGILGATLIVPELSGTAARPGGGSFDWFRAFWILVAFILHAVAHSTLQLMRSED